MIKRLAPLFVLCVMLGCGAATGLQEPFTYGDPFWLKVGHTAVSRDAETVVRFARVVENSTCPVDAVCIWAGRIIVEVGLSTPMEAEQLAEIELTAPNLADRQRVLLGRRVELLGFRPPNRLGGTEGTPELQLVVRPTP